MAVVKITHRHHILVSKLLYKQYGKTGVYLVSEKESRLPDFKRSISHTNSLQLGLS